METRNLSDQNKFQVLESLDLWLQRYMIRKVSGSEDTIQIFFDFTEVQILDCRDAFLTTQKLLEKNHEENELSYSGKIGFFSYEYLCHLAGFNPTAEKDLELPDALWARPQSIITLESGRCEIETLLAGRLVEVVGFLNSPLGMTISQKVPDFCSKNKQWKCNIDFDSYKELFDQAKEQILDGNTYQIKISQRYNAPFTLKPAYHFSKLMQANPAPESFVIAWDDFSMVSCSPEMVIDYNAKTQKVSTRPIGGTLDRAKVNTKNKQELESYFYGNEKEAHEHNMLIDLERNDLSRFCEYGSVSIDQYRKIETYAHVYHLVSQITGCLSADKKSVDIVRSMLPGGTVTGCPKMKTLELIDRFEPCFRGPYTGSFGTISDNGSIYLNLIIRTLVAIRGQAYVQAGGGIVVDSDAEYEYNENQIKAQALLNLLV